jgi:uncharacterized protein YjbI with pentapeptide repeats
MSDVDGTCEYVLDPDDPETWGGEEGDECYVDEEVLNEDGVWTCPHDAEEGEYLCIFHLPVEEKNDEEVVEEFLNTLDEAIASDESETQKRHLQFLGAKFGRFGLDEGTSKIATDRNKINFNHSIFTNEINLSDTIINTQQVSLQGVRCIDDAIFLNVKVDGNVRFQGSKFEGRVDFSYSEFAGFFEAEMAEFNNGVLFESTKFKQETYFQKTKFGSGVGFERVVFRGDADFREIEFSGGGSFQDAEFEEDTDFGEGTVFGDTVSFRETKFWGDIDFRKGKFKRDAIFVSTEFGGFLRFDSAEFNEEADFQSAEFTSGSIFWHTQFKRYADFRRTTFGGDTAFGHSNFRENVDFGGERLESAAFEGDASFQDVNFEDNANFQGVEFTGDAHFQEVECKRNINFQNVYFRNEADFQGGKFECGINFRYVDCNEGANFISLRLEGSDFRQGNLTDVTFIDTCLCEANLESALLSRATLFAADLRGAKLNGAVLGDVRIDDDTKFLGHPSEDSNTSPHTFSAIRSQPTCVYDPDYEEDNEHKDVDKAKSVYRALEELGGKHARPRLQARSFVRRQDLQKKDYWADATADDASLEERFIAGARWSRAKVARATLLYGESPWRVIAWSLGIILSFALLYPLGGWMKPSDGNPITYAQIASNPVEILNSVYYSTLTYTALGFGDFQPVGLGRLLTTVETGLGAVMLALLVFILGRRAAR